MMLAKAIRHRDGKTVHAGLLKKDLSDRFVIGNTTYLRTHYRFEFIDCNERLFIKDQPYKLEQYQGNQIILRRESDGMLVLVIEDPGDIKVEPQFDIGEYITVTGYKHCSLDKSYQGYLFKVIGIEQDFYMLKHIDSDGEIRLKRDAWFFAKATKTNVNNSVAKEFLPEN